MGDIMKKLFVLFAVIFCAMMFTGCLFDFEETKDTWFCREFNYGESEVKCYFFYSDSGFEYADMRDDVEIGPGMTIIVLPTEGSPLLESIGEEHFVIKTWARGSSLEIGEGEDGEAARTINMSDNIWKLLYIGIIGNSHCSTPAVLSDTETRTPLEDLTNFSWKKMLAQFLTDKLLDE